MSKAVSISEGGKGRIFPQTDKLKINNVGGGNSLWLPEDEVVTGTLYADENGIYLAENDGFSCYDTVVVRVEDETDPDDPDWELDPDELDEDVWDEESLEEFQEDPEAFEEKFNDKEKWKAEKSKKEKSQKIKKVKSLKPSKITGIDPVDGNPYEVGVDSEGNLTKEMLPSSIHIVVPPWKLEYEEGEEINFYGMHVYLLDKDGHPFKTEQYPTGEIPFEELLLPITVAYGSSSDRHASSDIDLSPLTQPIAFAYGNASYSYDWGTLNQNARATIDGFVTTVVYKSGNGIGIILAARESKTFFCEDWYINSQGEESEHQTTTGQLSSTFEHNGNTVYWSSSYTESGHFDNINARPCAGEIARGHGAFSALAPQIAWTMVYGDNSGSGGQIPVQFQRSDGGILEDSFQINVSEKSESNSTESNSTESDSGSGHTSGGF